MEKLREEADKEAAEEAGEEEGEQREKVDPREKTLKALLPPKRTRMTLPYEYPKKFPKMRTLKLRWIPSGLPVRVE